jgi:ubiquinone/menaquinone biosynthesis C-methylase UbiE
MRDDPAMPRRVRHPVFARLYAAASPGVERKGAAEHRAEMLAGLAGRVIEVGAGNGLNFAHYPPGVTEVVAVEPEPYLRARAEAAARATTTTRVTVIDGVADALPADDGAFDAAVASLVLCTVPDQARALAELRRVVREGGELRFYEHVVGTGPFAALQRGLDATRVWPAFAGGCHGARDTQAAIAASGWTIERVRRFAFKAGPVALPHIIGAARRAG